MVRRRGLGATAASAVIFSVLLVSNLVVFVASQDRAALYSASNAVDSLNDDATVMAGAGGANLLMQAQALLDGSALNCSTAEATTALGIAGLSDVQRSGNLTVTVRGGVVPGLSAGDNLSMLSPFNGSFPGALDIALHVVERGSSGDARISIDRTETHMVHLDLHLESAVNDCSAAVGSIAQALSASTPSNCTPSAVGPMVAVAGQGPSSRASLDGFVFELSSALNTAPTCSIDFTVSLEQQGIQGLLGPFRVLFVGQGSASFQPKA